MGQRCAATLSYSQLLSATLSCLRHHGQPLPPFTTIVLLLIALLLFTAQPSMAAAAAAAAAAAGAARSAAAAGAATATAPAALDVSRIVVVIPTDSSRLPLVRATRGFRWGPSITYLSVCLCVLQYIRYLGHASATHPRAQTRTCTHMHGYHRMLLASV